MSQLVAPTRQVGRGLRAQDLDCFLDLEWERQMLEEGRRPVHPRSRPVNLSAKIEDYLRVI